MATDVTQDRLAGTWNFNPVHSSATFAVKYLVAPFRGEFEQLGAELVDGRLSGSVKVASIKVKDENLAAHLAGPDFFDGERFPDISFSTSDLRIEGDAVTLEGELTIKGVTNKLSATGTAAGPVEDAHGNTRLGFSLETTIDRTAYGVSWNAPTPKGDKVLSNEVKLVVELEFVRAA